MEAHSKGMCTVAFSPNNTKFVTRSDDKTVRIWSVVTGECEQTLEGRSECVNSAAFSRDGMTRDV